mgnify:FL=1
MNNLRDILKSQGRTVLWLSKKSGVSRQTLYNIINKTVEPKPETRAKVVWAMDLPVELLFPHHNVSTTPHNGSGAKK